MKKYILIVLTLLQGVVLSAQYVGIGTENPTAMLDINGDVVFRTHDMIVADSLTIDLDVNTEKFSCYRVSGADSSFAIAGITAGMDGRIVTLINDSPFPMQLNHGDTMATEENRIMTGNHENLILDSMSMVTLQYDTSAMKWLVSSTSQVPVPQSVWDTSGTNIFFENFVGIGTEEPTAPLSIETEVDEIGFSHMAGVDSITVASSVSSLAGSVGTTTNHVFSLKAGGAGKVHIWPDGDVVFGEDSIVGNLMGINQGRMNEFDSKITVMTPLNETGYTHIAGDNQIVVNEAIGGVSASFGTMTNNTFRLKTNALGRLHILPDGKITISPNDYAAHGQLTVYTGNASFGVSHLGADGQILATHVGGPSGSASIGTHSNHHFRLACNGLSALSIVSPSRNVGIGIDFPSYKLEVNGTIRAKELIIETTGWPDYVFDRDYKRLSLSEVEQFIKTHQHLPNIPAAAELESKGLVVGEMQKKMMEKIEELTLYIIEQQKAIEDLRSVVTEMQK